MWGFMTNKYRYEDFTWPEVRDAVAENRVAVLPVGTVEQHGPHLPLVTYVLTATVMSRMAVERMPRDAWRMDASSRRRCCSICGVTWCSSKRRSATSIFRRPSFFIGTWLRPLRYFFRSGLADTRKQGRSATPPRQRARRARNSCMP